MILSFRTNSADPDPRGSLIRVLTVCNSFCIFMKHFSEAQFLRLNFKVISAIFMVSENLRKLRTTLRSQKDDVFSHLSQ